MQRISVYQLFTLTVFLQLGTTVIFGFASNAGRDAWLSVLISAALGIVLIILYSALMKMNPGLTLVEWFPAQLGKWVGLPLAWLYPLLFMYSIGRIFADLKSLIPTTMLPDTPQWVVIITILIVIIYCVFSGVEVLARFTEYVLPVLCLFILIEIIFLFSTGIVYLHNILPVLGKGFGVVFKGVWPTGVTQTFGETLTMAMVWPLVAKPEKVLKTTIFATITSTLILCVFSLMEVAVLGEDITERTMYPLYLLVKQITMADFLENLDAIVALTMVITAYVKVTIYFLVVVRSVQLLLKIEDSRKIVIPVGVVTYFMGMTMTDNINEHFYVATKIFPLRLWVPLLIVLPILLLAVTVIRQKWNRVQTNRSQNV